MRWRDILGVNWLTGQYRDPSASPGIFFMRTDILKSAINPNGQLPVNFVNLRAFAVNIFALSIRNVKHK